MTDSPGMGPEEENNMRRVPFAVGVVLILVGLLAGCTTAIYGQPFTAYPKVPGTYSLRVYIGGFSGGDTADTRAKAAINQFMASHGYQSYKIVRRSHHWIPSYFQYEVRFFKNASRCDHPPCPKD